MKGYLAVLGPYLILAHKVVYRPGHVTSPLRTVDLCMHDLEWVCVVGGARIARVQRAHDLHAVPCYL